MPPTLDAVRDALATVLDPEIRRPITELDMIDSLSVVDGVANVTILLTIPSCPLRGTISENATKALQAVPGIRDVRIVLGEMSDVQRAALLTRLRGRDAGDIPIARPESQTRIYAVASGKGGVGKSTVTVNLATALTTAGLNVGILDADIYGFSIPRMMGVLTRPTPVADLLMPPYAHGVKVVSAGMFVQGNAPIVWRGPMLHRALHQLLSDVFWGDLDVLLLDLPPGTGDIALSTAQLVPRAELLVVTTPQAAAAEVAERAGAVAAQTRQRIAGVIENMSAMQLPDGSQLEMFGSGGGRIVAEALSRMVGSAVPLLGQVPFDVRLREAGDHGTPLVLTQPDSAASRALADVARALVARNSLVGRSLGISPARH